MCFCILTWAAKFVNAMTPDPISGVWHQATPTALNTHLFNSLTSKGYAYDYNFFFPNAIKWMIISRESDFRHKLQDLTDYEPTLVQVWSWCLATNQLPEPNMMSYCVTRNQCVNPKSDVRSLKIWSTILKYIIIEIRLYGISNSS